MTTRFAALTDELFPEVQAALLAFDPKDVFCAAVDRNGYLPTHNAKFSKPQGADPVWNAAHARHRRVFNDRTGLAAGRSERRFLPWKGHPRAACQSQLRRSLGARRGRPDRTRTAAKLTKRSSA